MKKTLFALLFGGIGTFIASTCYGASSLVSWTATNTTDLTAWIGQVWSDLYIPILLGLGISLGFIILRKVIGLVKGGAR
jgi:hypothetical protein